MADYSYMGFNGENCHYCGMPPALHEGTGWLCPRNGTGQQPAPADKLAQIAALVKPWVLTAERRKHLAIHRPADPYFAEEWGKEAARHDCAIAIQAIIGDDHAE